MSDPLAVLMSSSMTGKAHAPVNHMQTLQILLGVPNFVVPGASPNFVLSGSAVNTKTLSDSYYEGKQALYEEEMETAQKPFVDTPPSKETNTPKKTQKATSPAKKKPRVNKPKTPKPAKKASPLTMVGPFACTWPGCKKVFKDRNGIRKHMHTHGEKRFVCTAMNKHGKPCLKRFIDKSKLKRHMLVHTGSKPHKCVECGRCFSLDYNLKTHMRTHTGEKPYMCTWPGCNRRFTQDSNLKAHIETHRRKKRKLEQAGKEAEKPKTSKKKEQATSKKKRKALAPASENTMGSVSRESLVVPKAGPGEAGVKPA
jgi:hypothetical protein